MDLLDVYHRGFREGIYTAKDIAGVFQEQNIPFSEELRGRNYDPVFLEALHIRVQKEGFPQKAQKNFEALGIVRDARKKDMPILHELFEAFERELYGKRLDEAPEEVLVLEHSKEDIQTFGLALLDPGISGALWYQIYPVHPEDKFFIHSLYIKPEFRKFHCGKRLIEESLDFALSLGCRTAALRSPEEVVPFYRKLGFHYDFQTRNEARTCRTLVKRL